MQPQSTLAFAQAKPEAPSARPLHYLAGLNFEGPGFVRLAAQRIAALDTSKAIDAALAEVPRFKLAMVESLVIGGLALRIAQQRDPGVREVMLAEVPEFLLHRVKPLAKSYATVRPWEKRGDS